MQPADLSVSLIQSEIIWENPEANRKLFEAKIKAIPEKTDLIILPEMFTTGFTNNVENLAETMDGLTVNWLVKMAQEKQAAITGSLIIQENEKYFNRLFWVQPDGNFFTYDKHHLFRMAGENNTFSAGKSKLIVEWKGWKICPLICYDLRFPVYSRWTKVEPYDLILYVANWPEKRITPWKTLLSARAIENLSYCIGVNRVGQDGNGILYSGQSGICNFKGDTFFLPGHTNCTKTQVLNYHELNQFRKRFPAFEDADQFQIQ